MSEYPCLSDFIEIIKQFPVKSNSDEAKAKSKLINRLKEIPRSLPGLDVQGSRDVFNLFDGRSVILDVSDVNDTARPFLFAFLTKLFGAVFHSDNPKTRRMKVIEEGNEVLGGHVDKRSSDIKESPASGILRDLRKSEYCGIVATHLPQDLEDAVLGNLGSVFCMRLGDGRSIDRAAQCINLERWQKPAIPQLADRHAIARFSRYGKPVQMVIKDAAEALSGSRPVSRQEARERSRPVLERFPFVKRVQEKVEDAQDEEEKILKAVGGLPTVVRRVYARIAELPWELVEDRFDSLGIDRDSELAARKQLKNLGLIRFAGKVGAKNVLFELTPRGRSVAERWK